MNRPCSLIYRFAEGEVDDEFGVTTYEEDWIETICEVQQVSGTEGPSGAPASSSWSGFFPAGVELEAIDAVNVPGAGMFEVVGPPANWRSPLSRHEHHVEAQLALTGPAEEEGS